MLGFFRVARAYRLAGLVPHVSLHTSRSLRRNFTLLQKPFALQEGQVLQEPVAQLFTIVRGTEEHVCVLGVPLSAPCARS